MVGPVTETGFGWGCGLDFNGVGKEEAVELCQHSGSRKGKKKFLSRTADFDIVFRFSKVDPIGQLVFWIVDEKGMKPIADLEGILQFDGNGA